MKTAGLALESVGSLALACCDLAVEAMAAAVRRISTEQGRSLDGVALVAFGGAGGLLACPLARRLGMSRVLTHPLGGLLSALGIAVAQPLRIHRASVRINLHDALARRVVRDHSDEDATGVDIEVAIPDWDRSVLLPADLFEDPDRAHAAFRSACRDRFGWDPGDTEPVITAVRSRRIEPATAPIQWRPGPVAARGREAGRVYRASLQTGEVLPGPLVVLEDGSTVHVDEGWRCTVLDSGTLQLDLIDESRLGELRDDAAGAALAAHRLQAIAEEMGALLRFTARSVNMRERLDYSCAIFSPDGDLVANGPHMPVHLGSMGASVRHVMDAYPDSVGPGDAVLLNDPYRGGTHLPDLTIVSGVFDSGGSRIAWVASRGHHSDVGGTTPGSMPPDASSLEEEGVIIDALPLVRSGVLDESALRGVLESGRWPCRAPDRVLDDLRAQLAANRRGASSLEQFAAETGSERLLGLMDRVLDQGEALVRRRIADCSPGSASMDIDDGGSIVVSVRPVADTLHVDFTGTSEGSLGNGNAPPAVTRAALLYVLRCLVDDSIPLNDGCLRCVRLTIPPDSLLSPRPGLAVAGGNVETSQLVVDALLAAMNMLSASQGTMNNLAFGDEAMQHYETICGGTGAGATFDGGDCVQGHMTNSRLTDPEVLERRFPVRLLRLARRPGSGGDGRHRGGDGVVRDIQWLAPLRVSLLSGRRLIAPPGLHDGGAGACGTQMRIHPDGRREPLGGRALFDALPGERFVIETPGGGGWGGP